MHLGTVLVLIALLAGILALADLLAGRRSVRRDLIFLTFISVVCLIVVLIAGAPAISGK